MELEDGAMRPLTKEKGAWKEAVFEEDGEHVVVRGDRGGEFVGGSRPRAGGRSSPSPPIWSGTPRTSSSPAMRAHLQAISPVTRAADIQTEARCG